MKHSNSSFSLYFLSIISIFSWNTPAQAVIIDGANKGIISSKERIDFRLGRISKETLSARIETRSFAQCILNHLYDGIRAVELAEAPQAKFGDNEEDMDFDSVRGEFAPHIVLKSVDCLEEEPNPDNTPTFESLFAQFLKFEVEAKKEDPSKTKKLKPQEKFVATTPTLTEVNPNFEPFLYRLTKEGQKNDVFLLGTQHNIPLDRFPKIVDIIGSRADLLIEEIHIEDWSKRNFGELSYLSLDQLESLGLYRKAGFQWFKTLKPTAEEYVRDHLAEKIKMQWGITPDELHPIVVKHYLDDILGSHRQGVGIDHTMGSKFVALKKPIIGLETDEDRLLAEDAIKELQKKLQNPLESHVVELVHTIECVKNSKESNNFCLSSAHIASYAQGNVNEFSSSGYKKAVQIRNLNWMPKLLDLIKQHSNKSILVMVGVGHFPGPKGLFTLLESEGYELKRVFKFGERKKAPLSLCNYIKNRTYSEILLDAANDLLTDDVEQHNLITTMIKRFSDPESRQTELSAADYEIFRTAVLGLRKFNYHSKYSVYEFGPPFYRPEYLRDTDFDYATSAVIENARKAKEWTRANWHLLIKRSATNSTDIIH
jgi:uncharacterized protein YbaP (TraB family)